MGLLGDLTAYIDNLKRRGSNTLADLATNPLGLLSRNLSAFSESLPAAPDSVMPSGGGLLNRPGFQQWGMDVGAAPKEAPIDPTEGMSTAERLLAGTGKAFVDIGRAAKQIVGTGDDQEIADARERDKALMGDAAGITGNLIGNLVASLLPAGAAGVALRGAAAVPALSGALRAGQAAAEAHPLLAAMAPGAASGALMGALEPTIEGESRARNMATNAAIGGAVDAAPRLTLAALARRPEEVALNAPMGLLGVTKGKWKSAYHATTDSFDPSMFDLGRAGSSSGHLSASAPVMWTTSRPETANIFISDLLQDAYPLKTFGPRGSGVKGIRTSQYRDGGNIQPVKVKLENPLVIKGADAEKMILGDGSGDWREAGNLFVDKLRDAKRDGFDGVIIKANPRGSLEFRAEQYLLFDPKSQVKSRFEE